MWITFQEAAEIAGLTVGDLCAELSRSGCVDPDCSSWPHMSDRRKVELAKFAAPPNHPNVKVRVPRNVDPLSPVIVRARCLGSVDSTHLDGDDLLVWLADRSARMIKASECIPCKTGR